MADINITYEEIKEWNDTDYTLVDLRDEGAVSYGTIPKSIWIPMEELGKRTSELPRDKKIVLFCAKGIISADAAISLREKDYDSYYYLLVDYGENGKVLYNFPIELYNPVVTMAEQDGIFKVLFYPYGKSSTLQYTLKFNQKIPNPARFNITVYHEDGTPIESTTNGGDDIRSIYTQFKINKNENVKIIIKDTRNAENTFERIIKTLPRPKTYSFQSRYLEGNNDELTLSFDVDLEEEEQKRRRIRRLQTQQNSGKEIEDGEESKEKEDNYYVFLDEIQEIDGFEKVVNGLNAKENVDVYITGSNSHLLSSDINTIFT